MQLADKVEVLLALVVLRMKTQFLGIGVDERRGAAGADGGLDGELGVGDLDGGEGVDGVGGWWSESAGYTWIVRVSGLDHGKRYARLRVQTVLETQREL